MRRPQESVPRVIDDTIAESALRYHRRLANYRCDCEGAWPKRWSRSDTQVVENWRAMSVFQLRQGSGWVRASSETGLKIFGGGSVENNVRTQSSTRIQTPDGSGRYAALLCHRILLLLGHPH